MTSDIRIHYCTRCIMPETKPDLGFDSNGVCSACIHYDQRSSIDWDSRRNELEEILDKYRSPDSLNYDCVVPVSGGKDSHYQVIKMLEYGMNPLCITSTTDYLTELGRYNIENLKNLGVDYLEVSTNPKIRRRINRFALEQVGDISWPEHVTMFTLPIRFAVSLGIPLIIWGENSQNEYGGPAAAASGQTLDRRWLEEFGGLNSLRVTDLVGKKDIGRQHLIQYTYPEDVELRNAGITGLFLGYFIPWDGLQNSMIAQTHGFRTYGQTVEGSLVDYENLDNAQTGIHDYFKYLKFGFGRATDLACMQIRRGRITRQDAIRIRRLRDGKFPWSYLGVPIQDVLDEIGISLDEFMNICEQYTNHRIFRHGRDGLLTRDESGDLLLVNDDNLDG